jgi:hypothetical protein
MSGYPGFAFGAQNLMPCSVSTARSSNREGRTCASGESLQICWITSEAKRKVLLFAGRAGSSQGELLRH